MTSMKVRAARRPQATPWVSYPADHSERAFQSSNNMMLLTAWALKQASETTSPAVLAEITSNVSIWIIGAWLRLFSSSTTKASRYSETTCRQKTEQLASKDG